MALNRRQSRVMVHRCNIYRATRSKSATTGEVTETGWRLVAEDVPCRYVYTQNDDDPQRIGRLKRRTALTEDQLHVPLGTDLRSQDYVRDVTSGSENEGTVHRVMGAPRKLTGFERRTVNKAVAMLFEEEKPPAGAPPEGVTA
jgi:hypothetical protein